MEEGRGRKRRELQVGNGEGHWRLLLTIHITIIFSSMLSHACTKNLWCCCHLCVCVEYELHVACPYSVVY